MVSQLFDLKDKVAIVTGSSRGLGFASAKGMAEHGAKIVISGRKAEACEGAAAEIRAAGGDAIAVPCNIGRKDELQRLVDAAVQRGDDFGRRALGAEEAEPGAGLESRVAPFGNGGHVGQRT